MFEFEAEHFSHFFSSTVAPRPLNIQHARMPTHFQRVCVLQHSPVST
ncbi:hypothetical protein BLAT2472_90310 [Burkholderia latens]